MNVLIFRGTNDIDGIDYAIEYKQRGDNVTVIQCDESMGMCPWNPFGSERCCKYCYKVSKKAFREYCPEGYDYIKLSSIISDEDKKRSEEFQMDFNTVAELKNILYDNVEIGYGAFSSYVTASQNVMPNISKELKAYIQHLMRMEIKVYEALKRFVKERGYDLIIFHNGRFAMYRPFLGLARNLHINYIATEHFDSNGVTYKNDFYNDVPHSVEANMQKARELWDKALPQEREEKGRNFYEWRKNGVPSGTDKKVYVGNQEKGKLPEGWDDSVENIAIFNSSEDEQCAIDKKIDSQNLFENQYVALKTLFEHYKNDKSKHFYLRIHPRLIIVPYKSHTALYDLKYDNVTIFAPESPMSSYTLMDHCDKTIVFNSTMGLEAAYWGKPVIALVRDFASEFNLAYFPETEEKFWELLDNKSLKTLNNENALIMGNFFLREEPPYNHIKIKVEDSILGHKFNTQSITKLFGSYALNRAVFGLFMIGRLGHDRKFRYLPETIGHLTDE